MFTKRLIRWLRLAVLAGLVPLAGCCAFCERLVRHQSLCGAGSGRLLLRLSGRSGARGCGTGGLRSDSGDMPAVLPVDGCAPITCSNFRRGTQA